MSRPRRPIFTPQTFRSVVGIKGNEFVLKNAFVGVSNDLYVFLVVMKLRQEVSNALLNHLSLRVVIEEYWTYLCLETPIGKPMGSRGIDHCKYRI